ncbi:MAG TPA: hypothetical protein VGL86_03360 [Polyangia bacterium]
MGRRILFCALVGLGACSSANRIERNADMHAVRAKELAANGYLRSASKEQEKADKLASKANTRRGFEDVMPVAFH